MFNISFRYQIFNKLRIFSGKAAIHDTCASFTTSQFQSARGNSNTSELSISHQLTSIRFVGLFQEALQENMKYNCDELYCELNDLQVIFYSILLLNLNDSYKDYM